MEPNMPQNEAGGDGRSSVRDKASGFAHTAKEKVGQQFEQKVKTATTELSSFASVLREAGNTLRDQGGSTLGVTALNMIADRVEGLQKQVDGGEIDDVVEFMGNFARNNSMAFVGTAFGLGFLAARFAKATSHRNHEANLTPYDESFSQPGYAMGETDQRSGAWREQ